MEEDRNQASEDGLAAPPNEASLRLQMINLLLSRPGDVAAGRHSTRPTLEQEAVLERIEAVLQAYTNFFYPPEQR